MNNVQRVYEVCKMDIDKTLHLIVMIVYRIMQRAES